MVRQALYVLGFLAMALVCVPEATSSGGPSQMLRSASEFDYPPFALVKPDGSADGFSVELLKAAARNANLNVSFKVGPWDSIKKELIDGDIDVLPLVSYSKEREQYFEFSIPYIKMHGTIFVRSDNTSIKSESDLIDKEVLVMNGDTAHEYAVQRHLSETLILTETFEDAMRRLSSGEHDAVIVQQIVGLQIVKKLNLTNLVDVNSTQEDNLKPFGKPLVDFEQKFCIAVKRGSRELLAQLNDGLSTAIANGTYDELYAKWFGPILPARPVDKKVVIQYVVFTIVPLLLAVLAGGVWYLKIMVKQKTLSLQNEIDERKRAEFALRENEARFRMLFENAPLPYQSLDEKGFYLDVNQKWLDTLGYSKEEVVGRWFGDYLAPEFIDHFDRNFPMFKQACLIDGVEFGMITKDGRKIQVSFNGRVQLDKNGEFLRTHCIFTDITERKSSELALALSESRFRRAIEEAPIPIMIHADGGYVISISRAWTDITGYTRDDIPTISEWAKRAYGTKMDEVEKYIGTLYTTEERRDEGEFDVICHDGSVRVWYFYSVPLGYFPDGRRSVLSMAFDITSRKEMEIELIQAKNEAESASKSKNEFLANMSHEVRTPLNGVLGMLQLLKTTEQTDEQREYVLGAIRSTNRLTRLLADILDISRIEAGKLQIIESEFSVKCLQESILEIFTLAAQEKSLAFEFALDPLMPPNLIGDETRIRQILFNLTGNAIKFTSKGSVHVNATLLFTVNCLQPRVLFTVRDTGIGISDEQINDIFEPFVQAEGSYTRRYQGAGLGLSIVRKLVKLLGGEIAIDNTEGGGTTIYLSLPFKLSLSHQGQADALVPQSVRSVRNPLRILLAEDDETSLMSAKRMLEKSGYFVVTAMDGQQALKLFTEQDFGLVLMDIQMPVMDGVEVTKAIRTSTTLGAKSSIPIIAMTAYAMTGDKEKFLAAGMNDYIVKPVDMTALREVIEKLMAKSPSTKA